MQFLLSVIHDRHDLATPEEMAAIDVFDDRLRAAGHWVFAGGLGWPSTTIVVDNRDGASVVSAGPVVDSTEFVAGFWILEAPDLEVALELATEGSRACHRKIEVRPFL